MEFPDDQQLHIQEEGQNIDPILELNQQPDLADEKENDIENDLELLFGTDPSNQTDTGPPLEEQMKSRINFWMLNGVPPEERTRLRQENPKEKFLEAPILNDVVVAGANHRARARDDHLKGYQNSTGLIIHAVAVALDLLIQDPDENDQALAFKKMADAIKEASCLYNDLTTARKAFLIGPYEEKLQKLMKEATPTTYLFGDNLNTQVTTTKDMEKLEKQMKKPITNNNYVNKQGSTGTKTGYSRFQPYPYNKPRLNWRSSFGNREVNRESHRNKYYSTSRSSRSREYPTKKHYSQSQPQRSRK